MATLVEKAVRIAMKADFDDAVAIVKDEKEDYLKVANSKADSLVEEHDRIITVFLAKDKRLLFVSLENPKESVLEKRIKKAAAEIAAIRPKNDYNGIAQGRKHYSADRSSYKEFSNIDAGFLSDMANGMINGAEDGGAASVAGTLYLNSYATEFCTSGGYSGGSFSAHMRVSIRCFGKISSFQDFAVLKRAGDLDAYEFGKRAAEMIKLASPNYVEVKGFSYIGGARESARNLQYTSMPSHEEIRAFAKRLSELTGYVQAAEHMPSRIVLLCRDEESKRNRIIDFSRIGNQDA